VEPLSNGQEQLGNRSIQKKILIGQARLDRAPTGGEPVVRPHIYAALGASGNSINFKTQLVVTC
jgi:hypothetical protein